MVSLVLSLYYFYNLSKSSSQGICIREKRYLLSEPNNRTDAEGKGNSLPPRDQWFEMHREMGEDKPTGGPL